MEGTALKGPEAHAELAWRGFKRGPWTSAIDVREFIVANATPYHNHRMSKIAHVCKIAHANLRVFMPSV